MSSADCQFLPEILDMAQRAAPAPTAVEAEQAVAQRRLRVELDLGVERGAHPQAARIDAERPGLLVLAELVDQLAADLLDEIAGAGDLGLGRLARHGAERFSDGLVMLGLVDEVVLRASRRARSCAGRARAALLRNGS